MKLYMKHVVKKVVGMPEYEVVLGESRLPTCVALLVVVPTSACSSMVWHIA